MNKRANYIYQLVGEVDADKLAKKKNGKLFHKLIVSIKNREEIKEINIFTDSLERGEILKDIQSRKYHGKKYIFFCKNYKGLYNLID
jgi:hypothetical protein